MEGCWLDLRVERRCFLQRVGPKQFCAVCFLWEMWENNMKMISVFFNNAYLTLAGKQRRGGGVGDVVRTKRTGLKKILQISSFFFPRVFRRDKEYKSMRLSAEWMGGGEGGGGAGWRPGPFPEEINGRYRWQGEEHGHTHTHTHTDALTLRWLSEKN